MTAEKLKDLISKAEEKIARKESTIEKKTARIEKKCKFLSEKGIENPRTAKPCNYSDDHEVYWTLFDVRELQEDIERNRKEIEEIKQTIRKYRSALSAASDDELILESLKREFPEIFDSLHAELVAEWDRFDIERRNNLASSYITLGHKEFIEKHGYSAYDSLSKTDEEIHTSNLRDARGMILNFYNRVREITGEVTDWKNVHCTVGTHGFPVLNGFVFGKDGVAEVESIFAGGYNIQRLHVRVLVKRVSTTPVVYP